MRERNQLEMYCQKLSFWPTATLIGSGGTTDQPFGKESMYKLLEMSGMVTVLIGIVIAVIGIIVLIVTEDSWILYAIGYAVSGIGVLALFWVALRDRLRDRKHENLDDVGFN